MQERGQEFGTTTGRRRRCGWFDAVLLRYAARVNGLTEIFLTKLDVLSGLPTVQVCVAYRYDGRELRGLPPAPDDHPQGRAGVRGDGGLAGGARGGPFDRRAPGRGQEVHRPPRRARRGPDPHGVGRRVPRADRGGRRRCGSSWSEGEDGSTRSCGRCRGARRSNASSRLRATRASARSPSSRRSTSRTSTPLRDLADGEDIDLTVIGPDAAVAAGLADALAARGTAASSDRRGAPAGSRARSRGPRTCAPAMGSPRRARRCSPTPTKPSRTSPRTTPRTWSRPTGWRSARVSPWRRRAKRPRLRCGRRWWSIASARPGTAC